ncbi:MAG TPA: MarR family winged helix-turn-helix transcriptional regulator [Bryobacteraceae bacterium]
MQKRTTIAAGAEPAQGRLDPPDNQEHRKHSPSQAPLCGQVPPKSPESRNLGDQSAQLLGYLDTLFRRLMLPRRSGDEAALEISREEIRALVILDSGERVMMSSLAESLAVPLSTATHTVDRLVAKGLVVRNRSEEDRRVVQVEMSDYGRKLQEEFRDKRKLMACSWLEPLSSGEREVFLELMSKITLLAKPVPEDAALPKDKR